MEKILVGKKVCGWWLVVMWCLPTQKFGETVTFLNISHVTFVFNMLPSNQKNYPSSQFIFQLFHTKL
mgnify:CR=1 FL=1